MRGRRSRRQPPLGSRSCAGLVIARWPWQSHLRAVRMCPPAAGAIAPAGPVCRPRPAPGMRDGVRAPAPHKHRGSAWDRFLIGWSARHRCAARSSVTEREPPHIGDRYGFRGPRLPIPRDCATESGLPAGFRVGGGQLDRQRRRHQQPGLCAAPARRPRRVIGNMRSTRRERALCPDAISVCLARLGRRGLAGSARRSQCSLSFLRSPSWQPRLGTEVPHRLCWTWSRGPGDAVLNRSRSMRAFRQPRTAPGPGTDCRPGGADSLRSG